MFSSHLKVSFLRISIIIHLQYKCSCTSHFVTQNMKEMLFTCLVLIESFTLLYQDILSSNWPFLVWSLRNSQFVPGANSFIHHWFYTTSANVWAKQKVIKILLLLERLFWSPKSTLANSWDSLAYIRLWNE